MTVYIIDLYDKYNADDRAAAKHIFYFHDRAWAIKEYQVVDGKLMRPLQIDEKDNANEHYYQYASLEEALQFIEQLRRL